MEAITEPPHETKKVVDIPEKTQCIAITKTGSRCKRIAAKKGEEYCPTHVSKYRKAN